jgi:hypothetical protein
MATKIDQLKPYSEACNNIRHYSNSSLAVRLVSIVQGIAILGAWAFTFTQKISPLMIVFPVAGLIFTVLLYRFHYGYYRATRFFYMLAAQIEKKFFEEDCQPIAIYREEREKIYRSPWEKILTVNAPFILIGTLFLLALIISAYTIYTMPKI